MNEQRNFLSFRLHSAATGGAPLWTEQWTGSNGVQVSDGLFDFQSVGGCRRTPNRSEHGSQNFADLPVVPIRRVCYNRTGRSKHQPPPHRPHGLAVVLLASGLRRDDIFVLLRNCSGYHSSER